MDGYNCLFMLVVEDNYKGVGVLVGMVYVYKVGVEFFVDINLVK